MAEHRPGGTRGRQPVRSSSVDEREKQEDQNNDCLDKSQDAGLTLGTRRTTTPSWRSRVAPSLERLRALPRPRYPPEQRVASALRNAEPLRAARAERAGATPPATVDAVGMLRELKAAFGRHVCSSARLPRRCTARRC